MPAKHYSIEEVNAVLPEINSLLGELLERRAKVAHVAKDMPEIIGRGQTDVGGAKASNLVQEFIAIERLADEVRAFGCEIKDVNGGLIDFLGLRNGREVYLCWRYGEEPVLKFYHELHAGFRGRQEIDPDDFA